MRSCQCPNCNASLTFDDNREFGFCQYCGTKIMLDDYRISHRYFDEARIKEAEIKEKIRLKELELAEEKHKSTENIKIFKIKILVVLGIIGVLMAVGGYGCGNLTGGDPASGFYMLSAIGLFWLIGIAVLLFFTFIS